MAEQLGRMWLGCDNEPRHSEWAIGRLERVVRKSAAEWIELDRRPAQFPRMEHPFHILKNLFRHRKTRYRGLSKNTAQLHSLFALANLFIARRCLPGTACK